MVNADASRKTDVEAILGRIMGVLGAKNDRQLAIKAGLSPTTISTWRIKARVPYDFARKVAQENSISLDYLILGRQNSEDRSNSDRFGLVNAVYFRACYGAAQIIAQREPGHHVLDIAFLMYNSMYAVFKMFEDGTVNKDEVLRSLSQWSFGGNEQSPSVAEYVLKRLEDRISDLRRSRQETAEAI